MKIEAGQPDAHIPFTLRRTKDACPIEARRRLGLAIPEFFRRVERRFGATVEYFCVAERHKSGWPHVHVAIRGWKFVHIKLLWQLWHEVTGDSDHLHVNRIPAKRAKRYLAKYLGKDLHRFGTAKRYWCTKGFVPADFGQATEEELEQWQGWRFVKEHPDDLVREYRSRGWFAHALGEGWWSMTPPPWEWPAQHGPPQVAASGSAPGEGL